MPASSPDVRGADPVGGEAAEAEPEPPIGLTLEVVHEAGAWGPIARVAGIARAAAAALAAELEGPPKTACLALSSDADVALLNGAYRGKRAPTNVLSFPAGPRAHDPQADAHFIGDIIVARETIAREAAERAVPIDDHLQHLVVHGLLHLLGFDHETAKEARKMEAMEVRVLAGLGIADPYAPDPATPDPNTPSPDPVRAAQRSQKP